MPPGALVSCSPRRAVPFRPCPAQFRRPRRRLGSGMPRAENLSGHAIAGRYHLDEGLDDGSFARVYADRDLVLERSVAVKIIHPWWAGDESWARRVRREGRTIARINHPGVVQIYDVGDDENGPWFVTELVHGESLKLRINRGPMSADEAARIGIAVADALGAAH